MNLLEAMRPTNGDNCMQGDGSTVPASRADAAFGASLELRKSLLYSLPRTER